MEEARRELEEEVASLHRDQELSDKTTAHQAKMIKAVRERVKVLEDKLSNTQNHMSGVLQEIMRCSMSIDDQDVQLSELEMTVANLTSQLEAVNRAVAKAQAAIDKRQNEIDARTREREELVEAKEKGALSPLEADIERVREELVAVEAHCQAWWITFEFGGLFLDCDPVPL